MISAKKPLSHQYSLRIRIKMLVLTKSREVNNQITPCVFEIGCEMGLISDRPNALKNPYKWINP